MFWRQGAVEWPLGLERTAFSVHPLPLSSTGIVSIVVILAHSRRFLPCPSFIIVMFHIPGKHRTTLRQTTLRQTSRQTTSRQATSRQTTLRQTTLWQTTIRQTTLRQTAIQHLFQPRLVQLIEKSPRSFVCPSSPPLPNPNPAGWSRGWLTPIPARREAVYDALRRPDWKC